jgi:alpha-amylase
MLPVLSLLPLLALPAWSLDDASMRARSVYQLVTDRFALPGNGTTACDPSQMKYCGGTWQTVIDHLDYIQGMGFDTVWISPVVENINDTTAIGQAYHGYWTLNPANLNSHFGSADDLKALSKALHDRSMYLQVDVVINHVAATSSSTFQPSSAYGAFSQSSDYHPFCWIQDYTNQTEVEDCWLGDSNVALADLNSESDTVQNYWNGWIKQLIADYNIDAIRLDTVKHVPHASWKSFTSSFDVFNQGEVLNDDPAYIASYQKNASVNPFNYAVYYPVTFTFNSTKFSMDQLISMVDQVKGNFSDPTLLGNFLNNHDNPRFESYQTDKAVSCYYSAKLGPS